MKTRNEIYQGEGAQLLRFITTYHSLQYEQVLRLFSKNRESIKSLITSLVKQKRIIYDKENGLLFDSQESANNPDYGMIASFWVLLDFKTEHSIPLYKRCVVCFSQIYDQSLSLQRIRDYDNLEFKQILDTIASYVLVDDTGLFCDSYHTTELGNYDHTVIFVMEPEIFPGWLKDRKESIKTISEIS